MPEKEESTQNWKVEKPKTNWEESTPLPELDQKLPPVPPPVVEQKVSATTEAKPKSAVGQLKTPQKPVGILARFFPLKLILILALLAVLGLVAVYLINFGLSTQSKKGQAQIDQAPKTQTPVAAIFRRLSSAFVPKNPSKEPADISANWVVAQDRNLGFSLLHPEEWQVSTGTDSAGFALFYPVIDTDEKAFGKTVLAKFSIVATETPANTPLAQFLSARYNFDNDLQPVDGGLTFIRANTFVAGFSSGAKFFILEGRVAAAADFEIFLPIFESITGSFKILQ